jgi:conserved hypothetical protein, cofD-related
MDTKKHPKIVVIGGGTGSFVVLSGLKKYARDITALVSMADDGGSTGQLRDELGVLPPGDVRQCLVALSHSPKVRDLFNYRFDEGSFSGHSFGNLFLTALERMTGDFYSGIELASEILKVVGKVEPTTLDKTTLCIDDGTAVVRHERNIEGLKFHAQRPKLWLEPSPSVNPIAIQAIDSADIVVIAPGNPYRSIGPALVVSGIGEALGRTSAKKIYICNLVNKPGQTDGFAVHDYVQEAERLAGTPFVDFVIYNTHQPSPALLERYAADGELPVAVDQPALDSAPYQAIGVNLLADTIWQNTSNNDPIASQRTLIRHDPNRLAEQIMKILPT